MRKGKFTEWIPLANYSWSSQTDYIVFARRNLKTGMIQFKTKRVINWWANKSLCIPHNLIDVKTQWNKLGGETNKITHRMLVDWLTTDYPKDEAEQQIKDAKVWDELDTTVIQYSNGVKDIVKLINGKIVLVK